MDSIAKLQHEAHENSKAKGWWDDQRDLAGALERGLVEAEIPLKLALVHSEISEALEEYRNDPELRAIYFNDGKAKPEGFGVELADAVIRIFDLCGALDIDLASLIRTKMDYNATRPHRHGGKRA